VILRAIAQTLVVAQGTEAGGHTGEIGMLSLVPQMIDAVRLPVLAAGGIADGRKSTSNLTFGVLGYALRRRRRARQPRCSSYGSLDGSLLKYCAFLTNFGLKSTVSLGRVSLRDSPLAGRT